MKPAAAALLAVLQAAQDTRSALPRTMVVAAHPDDETVGAGSRLPRLASARFVCVTDGAPRDGADAGRHALTPAAYAQARRVELEAVLALCGIGAGRIACFDCPDQQAALNLAALARRLAQWWRDEATQVVLTQPYEGGHPDHDATAFAVHAAAQWLQREGRSAPALVEMAGYHRGPDGTLSCAFLPDAGSDRDAITLQLSLEDQAFKRRLIARFTTQAETLRGFPVDVERYRPAPHYDFRRPPHDGPLHYELYPWGMTGERFRALADAALRELGLEERA